MIIFNICIQIAVIHQSGNVIKTYPIKMITLQIHYNFVWFLYSRPNPVESVYQAFEWEKNYIFICVNALPKFFTLLVHASEIVSPLSKQTKRNGIIYLYLEWKHVWLYLIHPSAENQSDTNLENEIKNKLFIQSFSLFSIDLEGNRVTAKIGQTFLWQ